MKMYPVHNQVPCQEKVWGSGDIGPHILNLSTTWRRMVSFMP